jgi:hypothetical protein
MRLTLTSIAAILSLCAISNLALGQSVEPQLEAPAPDIKTFAAGESYTTTFDTKNEYRIRILDGGVLVNGVGYTIYNSNQLKNEIGGTLNNNGTIINSDLENYGILNNNGTISSEYNLSNLGTWNNSGTINNFDNFANLNTLTNNEGAFLNNFGAINNLGTMVNNGTLNGRLNVLDRASHSRGILTGSGTIKGLLSLEGTISPGNFTGTMTTRQQQWFDGASYNWEINSSNGAEGGSTGSDLVEIKIDSGDQDGGDIGRFDASALNTISAGLDLRNLTTGGFGINIISLDAMNEFGAAEGFDDPNGEYEFVILTTVGGITGFDAENFAINDADFQNSGTWEWSIAQDGNNLVLSATGYTLVPEPSSLALLGMGGLGLLLRRKRS